ncbi:ribonuclease E [Escherichia coli]|uniref:Ribonuclease E n=1 Tax=Escherichia coli TaxID=562 RepID=A0A376UB95_ECOLX|nr:ribonuclease E [Escherichia coli]
MPIASYLLNEKRSAVNAIETRQDGVRCVIVPNDQMETPHYHVLRVRKGEETPTLSYMLPKLHEEAMALRLKKSSLNVSVRNNLRWQPLPCRMCRQRQRQLNLPRLL